MRDFSFERAGDEQGALLALGRPEAVPIAGGTELLNWMRLGIAAPAHVVDVGRLPGLDAIAHDGTWLRVGALATLNEVGEHPLVLEHAALLAQACLKAASPQVRNRATLGGNVLQRTRCAYFRAEEPLPWACNKRSAGSGCGALGGVDAEHAIFGWTAECVATQPSDPAVALACLDAEIEVVGPASGSRWISMRRFHVAQAEALEAGDDPATTENRLGPGELVRGYRIPSAAAAGSAYVKVRERQSYAYAVVSAGATARVEGGAFAEVRVALGSVAQRPWRLPAAESALAGARVDEEAVAAAVRDAMHDARPLAGNAHKVTLAANAAVRAVMEAAR